jgi:hypothetical protein
MTLPMRYPPMCRSCNIWRSQVGLVGTGWLLVVCFVMSVLWCGALICLLLEVEFGNCSLTGCKHVHFEEGLHSRWCPFLTCRNCALSLLELHRCHRLLDQGGRWVLCHEYLWMPVCFVHLFILNGWIIFCLQIPSCSSLLQSMLCLEFPFLTWCGIDPSIAQWGMLLRHYRFNTLHLLMQKTTSVFQFITVFVVVPSSCASVHYTKSVFLLPKSSMQTMCLLLLTYHQPKFLKDNFIEGGTYA